MYVPEGLARFLLMSETASNSMWSAMGGGRRPLETQYSMDLHELALSTEAHQYVGPHVQRLLPISASVKRA